MGEPLPLTIVDDEIADVTTINGVRYANSLFRTFGVVPAAGKFIMVEARVDGTLTLRQFSPDLEAQFRKAAGL